MASQWLTEDDDEPRVSTVVENRQGRLFLHGPSGWGDSQRNSYTWDEVAGDHGPVKIVAQA